MEKVKNILVVEDEESIASVIIAYLQKEGYKVFHAMKGEKVFAIMDTEAINFVILDLMLPDLPGVEICKKIRMKSQVPILMLTAKAEEEDRIYGLDIGADDYLTKPFSPKELVARVKAILRRSDTKTIKAEVMEFHEKDLIIDIGKREVKKKDKLVDLTATEFKLLSLLSSNMGRSFTRDELIIKVLGHDYEGYDRTIDTHIKNLRHKIEDKDTKYIVTVYGLGYKFQGE
ncbi:MAG: response regulator transcription factor [Clostridiaceae bacterium]|nr:response regulator transcription factor [Clostridiaceae bacterium]